MYPCKDVWGGDSRQILAAMVGVPVASTASRPWIDTCNDGSLVGRCHGSARDIVQMVQEHTLLRGLFVQVKREARW